MSGLTTFTGLESPLDLPFTLTDVIVDFENMVQKPDLKSVGGGRGHR